VIVDAERLRAELENACADAELPAGSFAAWIVNGECPAGATPVAYLHPAGRVDPGTVLVFRAVGAARAARHEGTAHRLAIWGSLPAFPDAALGPMLRHELEHARRWLRSGTAFYEADERLRAATAADGYAQLPTEREANAAAGDYARRVLDGAQLEALARVPDLAELLAATQPADVVQSTLALLGEQVVVAGEQPLPAGREPSIEIVG
jgi:hypothetical protein